MDLESLKNSRQREIKILQRRIAELEERNEEETSQIMDLNASYVSYESKSKMLEKKADSFLHINSILEKEIKAKDNEIGELVRDINQVYQSQKSFSLSMNNSKISNKPTPTKNPGFKIDLGN